MSSFAQNVVAAIYSIIEVIGVCIIGVLLAKLDILNKESNKAFSEIVSHVFFPAVSLISMASVISVQTLVDFWPLLFFCIFCSASGWVVGKALVFICKPPKYFERFFITAAAAPNVSSIPYSIVATICAPGGNINSIKAYPYLKLYHFSCRFSIRPTFSNSECS